MSYTDGIGNLQQALSSVAPTATAPTQQISAAEKEAQTGAAATTTATQTDRADLSTTGGLISKALEGSDVRTDKVAALQQAIALGSYNVSSSDVADKMIQSLLD